jgi:DnaD/phage-associated family protein
MPEFKGFSAKTRNLTQVPAEFFTDLLPQLDDLDEIKLLLFLFWYLQNRDENTGYASLPELTSEPLLAQLFGDDEKSLEIRVSTAIEKAVAQQVLLRGRKDGQEYLFFNSPRGKALQEGLEKGEWQPAGATAGALSMAARRPDIFKLYEENIGLLTPLMSDILIDAEKTYPVDWIVDAVKIAVERNARNWRYVESILRSWKEKGRNEKDQRPAAEGRKRDSEGEFGEFVRH